MIYGHGKSYQISGRNRSNNERQAITTKHNITSMNTPEKYVHIHSEMTHWEIAFFFFFCTGQQRTKRKNTKINGKWEIKWNLLSFFNFLMIGCCKTVHLPDKYWKEKKNLIREKNNDFFWRNSIIFFSTPITMFTLFPIF